VNDIAAAAAALSLTHSLYVEEKGDVSDAYVGHVFTLGGDVHATGAHHHRPLAVARDRRLSLLSRDEVGVCQGHSEVGGPLAEG
jgi:hypothetical protein